MNRTPADLSAAFRKMTSFISLILKAALFDISRLAMVSCGRIDDPHRQLFALDRNVIHQCTDNRVEDGQLGDTSDSRTSNSSSTRLSGKLSISRRRHFFG